MMTKSTMMIECTFVAGNFDGYTDALGQGNKHGIAQCSKTRATPEATRQCHWATMLEP
jgi:hypothetical protein